jgi:hypothetical protein
MDADHRAALDVIDETEGAALTERHCPATLMRNVQIAWGCPLPQSEAMIRKQDMRMIRRGAVLPHAGELAVAEAFDAIRAGAAATVLA